VLVRQRGNDILLAGAQGDRREENGREDHRLKVLQFRTLGG
jgi:hypothetical protein